MNKTNNKRIQRKTKKNTTRKSRKSSKLGKTPKFLLLKTAGGVKKYKLIGVKKTGGDDGLMGKIGTDVATGTSALVENVKDGAVELGKGIADGTNTLVNVGNTQYNECMRANTVEGTMGNATVGIEKMFNSDAEHICEKYNRI
jgi:hypothetical protein